MFFISKKVGGLDVECLLTCWETCTSEVQVLHMKLHMYTSCVVYIKHNTLRVCVVPTCVGNMYI